MMLMAKVGDETILETALVSLLPDFEVEVGANLIFNCSLCDHQEVSEISSVAKAAHREVVQFRDLLLLQKVFIPLLVNIVNIVHPRLLIMKVETISEAQRTGWNLAAPNLSDAAQVHLKQFPSISCYVCPGGALGQPARPCHEADWAQADGLRLSGGKPSCFTTLLSLSRTLLYRPLEGRC